MDSLDRNLAAKPVLLLVGSDMSVTEALQSYGRPFFGRAAKMTVQPLHLADVRTMTGLDAADAVDPSLITGGFPEIVQAWRPGMSRLDFLWESVANPLSPLLNTLQAKRMLAVDLPLSAKADTRNKRYRIADPYLPFWLAFLQRAIPLVERGRSDVALGRIERSRTSWRGCAVEPLIRECLCCGCCLTRTGRGPKR
ncbi:hypothetical protein [Streptomyces roseoverticillatus]|uniref:hypothetical protein n=1 Tax=Streptomyces roseoverticillatus TaxID=66429 RepID=UPI001FE06D7F|nr:hypothetical protein [Streptomyces roseoverticillatus]